MCQQISRILFLDIWTEWLTAELFFVPDDIRSEAQYQHVLDKVCRNDRTWWPSWLFGVIGCEIIYSNSRWQSLKHQHLACLFLPNWIILITIFWTIYFRLVWRHIAMPLKNLFRSVKRYDVSTRNAYVVCILLLNGSLIECTLTSDSTGQECLQNIAQRINLNEVSTA